MQENNGREKKNIALFVGKLTGGGAERAVGRLSIALSEYYDVHIFVYNTRSIDYDYCGKLIDIGNNAPIFPLMAIKSSFRINKVIKDNNIKLVISFLDFPNIINGLFNHSCKKLISIRVYYERGHLYTRSDNIKYPFVKKAIELSDGTLTLSDRQKQIISRDMKVDANKVFVVDNIFDGDEIRQKASASPDKEEIIEFINQYTTIAVGRLNFQKNYIKLLDIFKLVSEKMPDARLLILGKGSLEGELNSYAKALGIDKNVLLAGRIKNPFPYVIRSSAYISLSRFEGFPNSLVEAMACGLPVMHSDCPTGPAEILLEDYDNGDIKLPVYGDYGILLPLFEPGVFLNELEELSVQRESADIWCALLQDEHLRAEYSEKARKRAEKYEPAACITQYVNIINHILEE